MHRYTAAVAALAALVTGTAAPSAAASALTSPSASTPAAPDRAPHHQAKSVLFDMWFNGRADSPTLSIQFGVHRYTLKADCDSDALVGQLYHSATGIDPAVGRAFSVPCNRAPKTLNYQLRGGFYYFHFISGVDNTHIVADGA
ncbi:hypothetical protein [Streptomyces flavofungini]|uniref:Uncharacterized protein n=1 Tax=Streptomyces flavofungini TaxID=68200 RepID=A0ABS0X9S3_9ACTN|nr:hypothetical protein [Streptomyces flavofungini]MBJ3809719.1 hypothetical protein [Streptomyces flavofungini]GHC80300.1 hypothetical protein GCM10010349_62670 [Streptomyces flavofungini]